MDFGILFCSFWGPLEIISKNNSKVQLQNVASFLVIVIKQTYTDADWDPYQYD